MGLADRMYNIARGYLDKASSRWEEIDETARQDLDSYTPAGPEASPWDRAQAKIDAATTAAGPAKRDTLSDLPPGYEPPIPQVSPARQTSTVDAAYKVLGVPVGADFATVKAAYNKLKERTSVDRFPAGSPEIEQARVIERRINAAYMLLAESLDPADSRFDRLEL